MTTRQVPEQGIFPLGVQATEQGPMVYRGPPPSAVAYRIGGRYYPAKTVPGCSTCQHPYRRQVEQGLLEGRSYRTILEALPEGHGLNVDSVGYHVRTGHLPIDIAVRRGVAEQRAREAGVSVEGAVGSIVEQMGFATTVLQRTFERIAKGEIEPSVQEGLTAAAFLQKVQQDSSDEQADSAVMASILHKYMDAARQVMTEDQMAAMGLLLSSMPEFRDLADDEIVEVEVMELEDDEDLA